MTEINEYTIEEHSHRFAVWTAARAATRGMIGGTTKNVEEAIETSGIRGLIDRPQEHSFILDFTTFQIAHNQYCDDIIKHFNNIKKIPKNTCTYGRAAKIIAIYIKTRTLNIANHLLLNFAFPPIDSILLENLAKNSNELNDLKKDKWTKLDHINYNKIIEVIDDWCKKENLKMWEVEKYWRPVK
jgi:hypothetical protein